MVAHRIVWSVPVAGVILIALGRTADLQAAFRSPRTLMMAAATATLITVNWGIYVWAIAADRAVETALGYYINPLVSIVIAALLLNERLSRAQVVAVVLATRRRPDPDGRCRRIALDLADARLFLRHLRLSQEDAADRSEPGLLPGSADPVRAFARPTSSGCRRAGKAISCRRNRPISACCLLCGPVTTVPLVLFAFGAKLLRYSTIGIMQYIAPTIVFLLAIFAFHEPFEHDKGRGFRPDLDRAGDLHLVDVCRCPQRVTATCRCRRSASASSRTTPATASAEDRDDPEAASRARRTECRRHSCRTGLK